jgi:arylsulfatase A
MRPTPQRKDYPELPLIENEKIIAREPDQCQLTTWYTEHALRFMAKNKDRPFFLYLAHTMPHVPLHVSDKFKGKSQRGLFGDVVMEIDWSVGQILQALKQHGLDEQTLVIFSSDNGPWLACGSHAGSAGPLREGKMTTFEGGMRLPCVMRWPAKIPAGAVCREPVMTIDIFPTLAELTGAPLPRHKIDGLGIWPLISGTPGAKSPHEALYFYWNHELQAVRSGRWKLHFPHEYLTLAGKSGGRDGNPVAYDKGTIGLSLFDLTADPRETTNVAGQHPDVVARLKQLSEKTRDELGDSATMRKGKGVREPGRV